MKIKRVSFNNRRKAFEIGTSRNDYLFPYVKLDPSPSRENPVTTVCVDPELNNEAITYELASGEEGTVHIDHVLEYNRDPGYMRDLLLYKLTLAARQRVATCRLSKREIIRRLGTSPAQFYRLLDQTNYRKTIDQLMALLNVLECDVELVVRDK